MTTCARLSRVLAAHPESRLNVLPQYQYIV
jgi:hypothetical protein